MSILESVGNTPLKRFEQLEKQLGLPFELYLKMDEENPTGSAKDRCAKQMILDAEEGGFLKPGGVILEATSGNTGISLAAIGRERGYQVYIFMPENMSKARIKMMEDYGATVCLTSAQEGMKGSIMELERIKKERFPLAFVADQFNNPSNSRAHFLTTGKELVEQLGKAPDAFICGIGTGGTITGTAEYFKSIHADTYICGVEPASSPLLTKGIWGPHQIQGIGANFVPTVLDQKILDYVEPILNEEAFWGQEQLCKAGCPCGISSGANLACATHLAKEEFLQGKQVVVFIHDSKNRYV